MRHGKPQLGLPSWTPLSLLDADDLKTNEKNFKEKISTMLLVVWGGGLLGDEIVPSYVGIIS